MLGIVHIVRLVPEVIAQTISLEIRRSPLGNGLSVIRHHGRGIRLVGREVCRVGSWQEAVFEISIEEFAFGEMLVLEDNAGHLACKA